MKQVKVVAILCACACGSSCQYMDVSFCHDWYGPSAAIAVYPYPAVGGWFSRIISHLDSAEQRRKVLNYNSIEQRLRSFKEKYPEYEIPSEGKWTEFFKKIKITEKRLRNEDYHLYIKAKDVVLSIHKWNYSIVLKGVWKFSVPRVAIIRRLTNIPPCIFFRCDLEDTEQEMLKEIFEREILSKIYEGL